MEREKLKEARYSKGWSQEKASEVIGVSRNTFSQWERGVQDPHPIYAHRLCKVFEKTEAELDLERERPNKKLRRERELRGWSQNKLAEILGTAEQVVSRWESGLHKPNRYFQTRLCEVFGKNGEELGFMVAEQVEEVDDGKSIDKEVQMEVVEVAKLTEMQHIELSERLFRAMTKSHGIDEITLSYLETITKAHWQLFTQAVSKREHLSSVTGHLQTLVQLLEVVLPLNMRYRLCSLISETAQIIGEIFFDLHDYHKAEIYYHMSIRAAKEVDNIAFSAIGLGRLGFLSIYRCESQRAIPFLQEAQKLAGQSGKRMIHSWLFLVEAEVRANIFNEILCEKALGEAENTFDSEVLDNEEALWTRLNAATVPSYKGTCYLRLEKPKEALGILQKTLEEIPACTMRHRAIILADIAEAFMQQGEIEEACKSLGRSVWLTTQTKSVMTWNRAERVRSKLGKWREVLCVKELDQYFLEASKGIIKKSG